MKTSAGNSLEGGSQGLLVLGMHRSGTSVLTRLLEAAGARLGARLVPGSAGNDEGHWEDAFAVETNERLLADLGYRWDDLRALPADWLGSAAAARARAAIVAYFNDCLAGQSLWAIKDPRMCLLAPLWVQALGQAGSVPGVVLMTRHPREVARSLAVRDGMAEGKGLLAWLRHVLAAESATRGCPRVFVDYDGMLADPRAALARIGRLPGAGRLAQGPALDAAVSTIVQKDRRHHRAPDDDVPPGLVGATWRALQAGGERGPEASALDALAAGFGGAEQLFGPVLDELAREQGILWQRTARAEAEVSGRALNLSSMPAELAQLRELVDAHRTQLVEAIGTQARQMQGAQSVQSQAVVGLGDRLVAAYSEDIRRMQAEVAKAHAHAASESATAALARQLGPQVERLADALNVAQQRADRLESALDESTQRSQRQETELADLRLEKGELLSRISVLELEAAHARRRVAELQREADTLSRVRHSLSWRITRPMRLAARVVRNRGLSADDATRLRAWWAAQVAATRFLPSGVRERARRIARTAFIVSAPPVGDGASAVQAVAVPDVLRQAQPAAPLPGKPDVFVWAVIDWHFRIQRPQHLARGLAEAGHRVFYISNNLVDDASPGFRAEPLDGEGRLYQVNLNAAGAPAIYDSTPGEATIAQLRRSVGELMSWVDSHGGLCIVQHPFWTDVADAVSGSALLYDCMDHHAGFEDNAPDIIAAERRLTRQADLVIVTSSWLDEEVARYNPNRALIRNAAEYAHFCTPPEETWRDPQSRRVIGYFGAIAEWFDLDLVRRVAQAHPECVVLLVGNDTAGAAGALADLPNVILTGEVPYARLPHYLYAFDVALLPFKVIPLTLATNPVKVYEYLSAGKPVVSVDLPEIGQFGDLVARAADPGGFVAAVGDALAAPVDPRMVDARQAFARNQTWAHRAQELEAALVALPCPKVSVIVLTYNNLAFTEACLHSLVSDTDWPNLEIIVVDNASTDGSREYLSEWEQRGPGRRVILNDDNLGFSGGNNVGLAAATGDYLVLLNNDTFVTPGWVRTLVKHLRRDPGIGIIGPVTNNIGNEARIEIQYADMDEMRREAARYTRAHLGKVFDIPTVAFFCVAMPRSTYEAVGPMDEDFGVGFFEDDDYCRRVERIGKRVACADDVFIHHQLSASFDKLKAERKQELFRINKAIYEAKWGEWKPHAYRQPGA